MVYLIGTKRRLFKEIWDGEYQCPNCGGITHHHLSKFKSTTTIFFIPIITVTEQRLTVCSHCGAGIQLKKNDYNTRYKAQMQKFEAGQLPRDVILNDYAPHQLKMGWQIAKLVIAALFLLIMVAGSLSMIADIGFAEGFVAFLLMVAIGAVPFWLTLKTFLLKKKKQELYNRTCV